MDQLAEAALGRFGLSPQATATLCNVSENHTYRVEDPDSPNGYALRVHRPGYRTPRQIESELAVGRRAARGRRRRHADGGARAGRRARARTSTRPQRRAVGVAARQRARPRGRRRARRLQACSGRSRRACTRTRARGRRPPASTARRGTTTTRSAPPGTGAAGRTGSGWGRRSCELLGRLDETIRARLEAYGQGPERYGLVHADIRLANLLVDDGHVRVIDFDDSGFTWFMYDFATTVSFMEDHPRVPELQAAWLEGYRSVAPLDRRRRGRARHLRDAAPAAAGGLDRLAPHVRHRGRGARRGLHRRHLRAGGALPVNPRLGDPRRVHPSHRPHRPRHRRHQGHRQGHRGRLRARGRQRRDLPAATASGGRRRRRSSAPAT